MTPEGEAAQAERQATTQVTQHADVISGRIAAPVQGIALGTRPSRTGPNNTSPGLTPNPSPRGEGRFGKAVDNLEEGFVVTQRIEVMLVETATAVMIEAVVGCSLAEVALDGADTLLQQTENLSLIPTDGLRIGEVKYRILVGHAAVGIAHMHVLLNNLGEKRFLGVK